MKNFISLLIITCLLTSCFKEILPSSNYTQVEIYDEFWQHAEENYIYFDEKNVDWDSVYSADSPMVDNDLTNEELLQVMESSLLRLQDGHNVIRTPFRRSKKYNYTESYEVHFSTEVVEEQYIEGNLSLDKIFQYGNINDRTIYIHIPEMKYITRLQKLIREIVKDSTRNLIIDVRGNTGGNFEQFPKLLGDFVKEKTLLGSYIEKSGPQRIDETDPIPFYAHPSEDCQFDINVFILTDRQSFSASTYLAAMGKGLPNFTIVGQVTGGGGGGNADYELSNGWIVAVSVSDFLDKEMQTIEFGVMPDVLVENSAVELANGVDKMLEKVLELAD